MDPNTAVVEMMVHTIVSTMDEVGVWVDVDLRASTCLLGEVRQYHAEQAYERWGTTVPRHLINMAIDAATRRIDVINDRLFEEALAPLERERRLKNMGL